MYRTPCYFPPFFLFFLISYFQLIAQDSQGERIVLSPKVGDVIDLQERNQYKLFPAIEVFDSAVVIRLPDDTYWLIISYHDSKTGENHTKRLAQSEVRIDQLSWQIDQMVSGKTVFFRQPDPYVIASKPVPKDTGQHIWFSVGLGAGAGGLGTYVSSNYQAGPIYFNAFTESYEEFEWCDDDCDDNITDEFSSVGLMIGRRGTGSFGYASMAIGISYVTGVGRGDYMYTDDYPYYKHRSYQGIGIPVEVQLAVTSSMFGLGFRFWGNFNKARTTGGFGINLQLGNIRK